MAGTASSAATAASSGRAARGYRLVAVPRDSWDRVALALRRSLDFMPADAVAVIGPALDNSTLWTIAAALGTWAGVALSGLGAVGSMALSALPGAPAGVDLSALIAATRAAADATTAAGLETASQRVAQALLDKGPAAVAELLRSEPVARLRAVVDGFRPQASRNRDWYRAYDSSPDQRPSSQSPAKPDGGPGKPLPTSPASQGAASPAPAPNASPVPAAPAQPFPWGVTLGVTAGVLAVLGVVAIATTRKPARPSPFVEVA